MIQGDFSIQKYAAHTLATKIIKNKGLYFEDVQPMADRSNGVR